MKGLADGVDQPVRSGRRQINADREQKTQTGGCETENQKNEAHGKRQVIKMDQKHQCIDNISEENSDQHGQCVLDGDAALNDDLPDETYKMQQNGQIPDGQRCDIGQGSGDGGDGRNAHIHTLCQDNAQCHDDQTDDELQDTPCHMLKIQNGILLRLYARIR